MPETDPVALTQALVRCPSVTPEEGGALLLLEEVLTRAGFSCTRVDRGGTANLFARLGPKGAAKTLGFNGHTDVVPVGDAAAWSAEPFGGEIRLGQLWGRGAADMKSGVAAWVAAAVDYAPSLPEGAALVLTITGDEEGDAEHGTVALLDWMAREGESMAACIVGEPTCPERMGEMMKIGRRGSMNATFTAQGVQGHAAYPQRAKNAASAMARLMSRLDALVLDEGTAHFDASTLAVTSIDVGNPATNVIPATARGMVNIRFNDAHSSASLTEMLLAEMAGVAGETGVRFELAVKVSGESFLTPPGPLSALVAEAVREETGLTPALSTSGGTSDARFIKALCPVVEFGLVGSTMHQVDERVRVDDIEALKRIYLRVMQRYFAV